MSELNKYSKKEQNTSEQQVDKSRRRFSKAGAATPILMTLASQPVFGNACMSRMMSGNQSAAHKTIPCTFGYSPGSWKNIETKGGSINEATWHSLGLYPRDEEDAMGNVIKNSDGTVKNPASTISNIGLHMVTDDDTLLSYLQGNNAPVKQLITAYLNALYVPNYFFTTSEVVNLSNGATYPGKAEGLNLNEYLQRSWGDGVPDYDGNGFPDYTDADEGTTFNI